jgi:alcohol dehydrogenase class IV
MVVQKMSQAATMMFGVGALSILGDQLKMRGLKKPIIVTDKGVTAVGVTDKVKKVVTDAGLECAVYDGAVSDPPFDSIAVAADAIRASGADSIIALGGGSSIDTAKAASIILDDNVPISERIMKPPRKPDLPFFTIPTTSGTGSEVTFVAVLSDPSSHKKTGVVITGADLAIVDPELTVGMPPLITAQVGMDVVAHAVEAITNGTARNPMSDIRGYEACRLVAGNLPDAVKDGMNLTARSGMSLASSLAGMAFSDSVTTFAHANAQSMASTFGLHHGLLCGLGVPPEMELFAIAVPERVRKIAEIFGADVPYDATPEEIGKICAKQMRQFMALVGLPSFSQLGYTREQVVGTIDSLMEERMKDFGPVVMDRDNCLKALNIMYDYEGSPQYKKP